MPEEMVNTVTLFKFNPPGEKGQQEPPKETKTDTTGQQSAEAAKPPVTESAPPPPPPSSMPSQAPPTPKETPQPAAPTPAEEKPMVAPVPPVQEKPAEAPVQAVQAIPVEAPAQQPVAQKPTVAPVQAVEEKPVEAPVQPVQERHVAAPVQSVEESPAEPPAQPVEEESPPTPRRRPTIAPQRMLTESPSEGKNALLATILSILLVVVAIGLYVYLGEKPPVATGEVTNMWIYSVHTQTRPLGGEGAAGQPSSFDQVIILAKVKLRNQSNHPIVLWDMSTNVKNDTGEIEASAVGPSDFRRAFVAYPKLVPAEGTPLLREMTLDPGEQTEGMILTHYTMTKEEWEKRSSLNFKIVFRYQKSLILQPPRNVETIE